MKKYAIIIGALMVLGMALCLQREEGLSLARNRSLIEGHTIAFLYPRDWEVSTLQNQFCLLGGFVGVSPRGSTIDSANVTIWPYVHSRCQNEDTVTRVAWPNGIWQIVESDNSVPMLRYYCREGPADGITIIALGDVASVADTVAGSIRTKRMSTVESVVSWGIRNIHPICVLRILSGKSQRPAPT